VPSEVSEGVAPPLDPAEATRILEILSPVLDEEAAVLVGGQALVALTDLLQLEDGLTASKDIDFVGGKDLVVLPTDVVNAADRRPVSERAVWPAPVVVLEPVWQRLVSLSM
jgi:hypothetical protein